MTVDELHNRIFILMKNRHWTLYKLAEQSGMSGNVLYNMVKRKTMPRVDTLENICRGLNISLSEFFSENTYHDLSSGQSDRDFALLEINHGLTEHSQDLILSYAKGIRDLEILMGHHKKRG